MSERSRTYSDLSAEEAAEVCNLADEQLRSRGPPYKSWTGLVVEVKEGNGE